MIPFQGRQKLRKILYSKVTLLVLAVFVFFVGRGAWNTHEKAQIARSERNIAERSLTDLESRAFELQASLAHLKTARGIEEEVRQKYTVARPGEEVVIIVDDSAIKGENGVTAAEKNFWQGFILFFIAE
ncbi:MAG: hypothetical protein WAV98_03905 [Minisyncoccia bacterium]